MSSLFREEKCSYSRGSDAKPRKSSASGNSSCTKDTDIDMVCLNNALHELGMLSAITESRKQFLQESAARKAARPAAHKDPATSPGSRLNKGFCVLRMNSDYVTDLSGVWKCGAFGKSSTQPIELTSDARSKCSVLSAIRKDHSGCCYGRAKTKFNRFRVHVQKPYNGPWMQRWESHEWFPHAAAAQSEPLTLPKEGSANRSNPGSPEKDPLETSVCSLARSRSLDDIENLPGSGSNSEVSPIATRQRSEIETMSQKLEGLHVV